MFKYNGLSLYFIVTFNAVGEIIQLETKRYMEEKNRETWIIKLADYKAMNNVMIPMTMEVLWRLQAGDLSYAKFNIKIVVYNEAGRFWWSRQSQVLRQYVTLSKNLLCSTLVQSFAFTDSFIGDGISARRSPGQHWYKARKGKLMQ